MKFLFIPILFFSLSSFGQTAVPKLNNNLKNDTVPCRFLISHQPSVGWTAVPSVVNGFTVYSVRTETVGPDIVVDEHGNYRQNLNSIIVTTKTQIAVLDANKKPFPEDVTVFQKIHKQ